ncbi:MULTISPECIES: hypothetical protein [Providencia]|uniref:Type 1 fimbrial protein n=1 Tax=Providencia manganoxydans TaxID=2923283 RepID=A0ABX7AJ68_9GAMM|nr:MULTISPECIES: hypothetical protein [Providencia]MDX4945142.1 hypothetical protein [Providencia manganoxydans]QQO63993.1 hypothetical protein JI723_08585 [Providencia manganoxydans]HEF8773782.1 hypothetical protein [Providencia stuartii]
MKLTANKPSLMTLLFVITLSYFITYTAHAEKRNVIGSATITFVGAIVVPPCQVGTMGDKIETTCWSDRGKVETVKTSFKKLKTGTHELPNHKGTQSFKWIDQDKKLGMYTLDYN